jgi:hypothetical protein
MSDIAKEVVPHQHYPLPYLDGDIFQGVYGLSPTYDLIMRLLFSQKAKMSMEIVVYGGVGSSSFLTISMFLRSNGQVSLLNLGEFPMTICINQSNYI